MYYIVWLIRVTFVAIYWIILCSIAVIACTPFPKHRMNMYRISRFVYPLLKPVYGIQTYIDQDIQELPETAVYISNHQNSMDIVILAKAVQPNTVTVGKKQLAMIPFFGWMYWIGGNILIDKKTVSKAYKTVLHIVNSIKSKNMSVWLFPEGTRSYGKYEMADFKVGAFLTAIEAGVPIVPIVVSDLNKFRLGNIDNGAVIIKYMQPINTKNLNKRQAKELASQVQEMFLQEYRELNRKVATKEFTDYTQDSKFNMIPNKEYMAKYPGYDLEHHRQPTLASAKATTTPADAIITTPSVSIATEVTSTTDQH